MIEILAGDGFACAIEELGLNAEKKHDDGMYQVWCVDQSDFDRLCVVPDEDWKDDWGWWRYCEGCNLVGSMTYEFTVNGKPMIGFFNEGRYSDFVERQEDKSAEDWEHNEEENFPTVYKSLTEYLCEHIGASTEKNVCAIAVDLAKMNHMTMAELFDAYQPSKE